nr:hypothetical protein [Tanacetum cinerariifolium]
ANGNCDSPLLGVNTPKSDEDRLKLMELMVFVLKKGVCDEFELNAARLSKFLLSGKSVVKRSGDVTRLQALVDKKRIVISEEVVREILQLNDAKGVICLPNDEIFAGLARMGDSPLLGVNTPRSDEDRLELMELMVFVMKKDFWNTAVVKRSGDVTRLQALVDKKRVVITEEVVREIL